MKCPNCKGTGEVASADMAAVKSIVSELNRVAGTNYKATTKQTVATISARLSEGWTAEDFAQVIKTKCDQWLRKPEMRYCVRPITLFGPKFEGYVNEAKKPPKQKVKFVY